MSAIAQISDLHVVERGALAYGIVDTVACAKAAIDRLNHLEGIDALFVTGDLVQHGTVCEYAVLLSLLETLTVPYYLLPGNHDRHDALREVFSGHKYLGTSGSVRYHVNTVVDVLAIDTVRDGFEGGHVTGETLTWLAGQLPACAQPVMIAMHHPPIPSGSALDRESLIGREDLERLVRGHDVRRIIAGHYHRAITAAFAGTIVSVCPSTAHQLAWDGNAFDELRFWSEPPALLIHERIGDEMLTHVVPIDSGEHLVLG